MRDWYINIEEQVKCTFYPLVYQKNNIGELHNSMLVILRHFCQKKWQADVWWNFLALVSCGWTLKDTFISMAIVCIMMFWSRQKIFIVFIYFFKFSLNKNEFLFKWFLVAIKFHFLTLLDLVKKNKCRNLDFFYWWKDLSYIYIFV